MTLVPIDRTLAFDVAILDINDNTPTFDRTVMNSSVRESTQEGINNNDDDDDSSDNNNSSGSSVETCQ